MTKNFWVRAEDEKIFSEWLRRRRIKFSVESNDKRPEWKIFSVKIEFRKKFDRKKILQTWRESGTMREAAEKIGCSQSYVQKVVSEDYY